MIACNGVPGGNGVPQRGCLVHREKPNDLRALGALNRVGRNDRFWHGLGDVRLS
jgi:hypothetical protein